MLAALAHGLLVHGNRLIYEGRPIALRGVCVGDVLLARSSRRVHDYRTIAKAWRSNCVRIGVAPVTWRREPKLALAALRADVAAALDQGMFVIVDWHAIGFPDGYTQPSDGKRDLYDSDFRLATSFWKAAAKAYKGEGRVVFQLWCEPVFQRQEWRTKRGSMWPRLKPFFQRLTDTIRGEGAGNLLLATGTNWAYDLQGVRKSPLPDANTAYEWHVYPDAKETGDAQWSVALDGLDRIKPVLVTEWGFQRVTTEPFRGTAASFGTPFLRFIEAHGLSWTAWCWHPEWTPNMLEDDWRTPTEFGRFVKATLAATAKDPAERSAPNRPGAKSAHSVSLGRPAPGP